MTDHKVDAVRQNGKTELTVTKVERRQALNDHELLSHHRNLKRRIDLFQKEIDVRQEEMEVLKAPLMALAEEQILIREAEMKNYEAAEMAPGPELHEDLKRWKAKYAEFGGDVTSLTPKIQAAREDPAPWVQKGKIHTG